MHSLDDPYPELAHLRATSPVSRIRDSPFHLVTSWALVTEAADRTADFSSNLTSTMVWNEDGSIGQTPIAELGSPLHVLATADDPLHRLHRSMSMPSVSASRLRRLRPHIDSSVAALWSATGGSGSMDWVRTVAQRLPMVVVAEMIGFPSYDVDDLLRWSFASTALLDGVVSSTDLTDAVHAVGELSGYLTRAFAAAKANPGDNALGDLARREASGELDPEATNTLLLQLVIAGAESTVSLLGSMVWLLGQHPDIQRRLRADPGLVPDFIEETLRLESPFRGHYRHVLADTELGGVPLAAGSMLYLSWAAANRDPEVFDRPDELLLDDDSRPTHLAFGRGVHRCVGAGLARLEAIATMHFLLDNTSWVELDSPAPRWERSLLVRRLETLSITVTPH